MFGIKVIAVPYNTTKIQLRKHKKKRINKKWAKIYGCKIIQSHIFDNTDLSYLDKINNILYCHPTIYDKLKSMPEFKDILNK